MDYHLKEGKNSEKEVIVDIARFYDSNLSGMGETIIGDFVYFLDDIIDNAQLIHFVLFLISVTIWILTLII